MVPRMPEQRENGNGCADYQQDRHINEGHHVPRHGTDYSRLSVMVRLGKRNLENRAIEYAEWSPYRVPPAC